MVHYTCIYMTYHCLSWPAVCSNMSRKHVAKIGAPTCLSMVDSTSREKQAEFGGSLHKWPVCVYIYISIYIIVIYILYTIYIVLLDTQSLQKQQESAPLPTWLTYEIQESPNSYFCRKFILIWLMAFRICGVISPPAFSSICLKRRYGTVKHHVNLSQSCGCMYTCTCSPIVGKSLTHLRAHGPMSIIFARRWVK